MKSILLMIAAIAILAGGGAAGYLYFKQPAAASIGDNADHQSIGEAQGIAKSSRGHFVELDALILPIVDENGVSQVVTMIVVIEVKNASDVELVTNLQPRLKDAYIQELYGVLNRHAALQGGVLQVGMIKSRLSRISGRVLGDDVVTDVLLQVVQQRPI